MRRVDRQMNALQTDRPTDTASYRGALSHLKRKGLSIAKASSVRLLRKAKFKLRLVKMHKCFRMTRNQGPGTIFKVRLKFALILYF